MRKQKFPFSNPSISSNSILLTGDVDSNDELYIPLSEQLANGILVSDSSVSDEDNSDVIDNVSQF